MKGKYWQNVGKAIMTFWLTYIHFIFQNNISNRFKNNLFSTKKSSIWNYIFAII